MYQYVTLGSTIREGNLQLSDSYSNLVGCIDNVVYFINRNGDFAVIGWYKRWIIDYKLTINGTNTDQSNKMNKTPIDSEIKVDIGELNFQTCFIKPTNRNMLNINHHIGR